MIHLVLLRFSCRLIPHASVVPYVSRIFIHILILFYKVFWYHGWKFESVLR